jgi:uncharacterized protein (TIGR03084 family)
VLTQAADYREECRVLYALLRDVDDSLWHRPTQFKGWTVNDVIAHLHMFDQAAELTLERPDVFRVLFDQLAAARARGTSLPAYTRERLRYTEGRALLSLWYEFSAVLARKYQGLDPARRVIWAGPSMSVRSCISARQMETWAHGQAVFDLLGVSRAEDDRIRNIVVMGVNTYAWTFNNRGMPPPQPAPHIRLTSPSGAIWEFNAADSANAVTGSAVEFCQVVTQTRNIADTQLQVRGNNARLWMSIAQCFAGSPEQPPAPGERGMSRG